MYRNFVIEISPDRKVLFRDEQYRLQIIYIAMTYPAYHTSYVGVLTPT